ncbi:hypothetical protein GCM10007939_20910 [Amylibacter marinus]|uniref:Uncharacterized protein n=1 Tax=Amylibacter marinus TaxID=1475483 RepID=A0ABQ5VWZ4_9RHOB|nr:hypothetical protein [Amylibacter marinus]GLQ35808.1 hypothetical protein GCM10007939_20910 [Amylibacter marinus]
MPDTTTKKKWIAPELHEAQRQRSAKIGDVTQAGGYTSTFEGGIYRPS